jgi:hypothetical protein
MMLAGPMEFLDLHDGEQLDLQVMRWEEGTTVIHPTRITPRHVRIHMDQRQLTTPPMQGEPVANEIPVLRLWGYRLNPMSEFKYWDTSSKTLQADLVARFNAGLQLPAVITLSAHGKAPQKRYSVSVS